MTSFESIKSFGCLFNNQVARIWCISDQKCTQNMPHFRLFEILMTQKMRHRVQSVKNSPIKILMKNKQKKAPMIELHMGVFYLYIQIERTKTSSLSAFFIALTSHLSKLS